MTRRRQKEENAASGSTAREDDQQETVAGVGTSAAHMEAQAVVSDGGSITPSAEPQGEGVEGNALKRKNDDGTAVMEANKKARGLDPKGQGRA